jgi:hypothetical protein
MSKCRVCGEGRDIVDDGLCWECWTLEDTILQFKSHKENFHLSSPHPTLILLAAPAANLNVFVNGLMMFPNTDFMFSGNHLFMKVGKRGDNVTVIYESY